MGICCCKCKGGETSEISNNHDRNSLNGNHADNQTDWYMHGTESNWWKSVPSKVVDNLVLDTLNVIGTLVEK